jgi:hypothetical protein
MYKRQYTIGLALVYTLLVFYSFRSVSMTSAIHAQRRRGGLTLPQGRHFLYFMTISEKNHLLSPDFELK